MFGSGNNHVPGIGILEWDPAKGDFRNHIDRYGLVGKAISCWAI
jgi:hypothetical protein